MTAAVVCSDLSFSWPDGACVLSGVTLSIGTGRTGLIGVNGSGKLTLLKLIAGEPPCSGPSRARRRCPASPSGGERSSATCRSGLMS